MISTAENEFLTRVGRNTPMGKFMRQFWIAVDRAEDLPAGQAKPIRIMSEDYALYRGASGQAQVIDYRCPHRGAQMHLGWVEGDDIRDSFAVRAIGEHIQGKEHQRRLVASH